MKTKPKTHLFLKMLMITLMVKFHTTQTIMALVNVVDVDDDNEPSPENIPQPNNVVLSPLKETWGHSGFCYR